MLTSDNNNLYSNYKCDVKKYQKWNKGKSFKIEMSISITNNVP